MHGYVPGCRRCGGAVQGGGAFGAVCRQPPRAGGAAGLPRAGRAVPPPRVRVLRGLRDRRRCGVPGGAGPLSVRPRRGVRRLRVRPGAHGAAGPRGCSPRRWCPRASRPGRRWRGAPCGWSSAARWWCCSPNGPPTGSGVQARGLRIARRSTTSSRLSWWPHSRRQLRRSVRWRPPTCSPRSTATGWCRTPSGTASATTSTEGRERSIGLPLSGKATPMHSPALADLLGRLPVPLRTSGAAHSPRPRVVVCGPYASRGAREGATGGGHRLRTLPRR